MDEDLCILTIFSSVRTKPRQKDRRIFTWLRMMILDCGPRIRSEQSICDAAVSCKRDLSESLLFF